jgi:hypothetical protein
MKKIICICIATITFQILAFPQCGINYKELLDKYCNGVYLQHQELDNASNGKITFIFKKDDRYAIYLLNPSRMLPEYSLIGSSETALKDVVSKENKKEKISTYIFTAGETGKYNFSYRFNTKEDACVLMAVYLQNSNKYQPGVYRNFEEMKYNNPSAPIQYKVYSSVLKIGLGPNAEQVTLYQLDLTRSQAKELGKLFGFSDGKNLYIEQKEGIGLRKDFIKIENYGKYGYFEDVIHILIGTTIIPVNTLNLIDMNSGEIILIDKKQLKELLKDDPTLLEEFNNEAHKDKKLKDFLIRYLEKKNIE